MWNRLLCQCACEILPSWPISFCAMHVILCRRFGVIILNFIVITYDKVTIWHIYLWCSFELLNYWGRLCILVFLLTLLADGLVGQGNRRTSLWWVIFFPSGRFALEFHFYICCVTNIMLLTMLYVIMYCLNLLHSCLLP